MNYYRALILFFTENHRTQSQFDRHRVTKLVLFEFVNNFMSLFYIAFIIQDMEMLRYVCFSVLFLTVYNCEWPLYVLFVPLLATRHPLDYLPSYQQHSRSYLASGHSQIFNKGGLYYESENLSFVTTCTKYIFVLFFLLDYRCFSSLQNQDWEWYPRRVVTRYWRNGYWWPSNTAGLIWGVDGQIWC